LICEPVSSGKGVAEMIVRGAEEIELLLFELGGQRYALPVADVVEVLRAVAVTPLPQGPRVVLGVMNVRGRVVPVFDLRERFGQPSALVEPSDHFIVAHAAQRLAALRADKILDLVRLCTDAIEQVERVVSGMHHISGIGRLSDGVVFIHDLHSFLTEAESATLDRALDSGAVAP
jgi:purine-binding chemotaxis protein CheW